MPFRTNNSASSSLFPLQTIQSPTDRVKNVAGGVWTGAQLQLAHIHLLLLHTRSKREADDADHNPNLDLSLPVPLHLHVLPKVMSFTEQQGEMAHYTQINRVGLIHSPDVPPALFDSCR